jgi:hypothetical protein
MKKRFQPQASDLFDLSASKSQEQQMKIIQTAIKSYAQNGIEKTTYTLIAKECGISRPLVHHYFPKLDDLFILAAKYVRQTLLNLALDELRKHPANDPQRQLQGYLRGCLRWVAEYHDQCSFWFLYFYQASRNSKARKENTLLVTAGHKRIQEMIEEGNRGGIWKVSDTQGTAKMIQIMITGTMISCMSEDGYLTIDIAENLTLKVFKRVMQS